MRVFCPLVTNNIEITAQGHMKPCCISSKKFKIDNNPVDANKHTISQVIEHSDRQQWIENFHENYQQDCKQCYEIEKSGGESKRQLEVKLWNNNLKYDKQVLQSIDLKMGNTCNLACSICGSHSSSKWGSVDRQFGIAYVPAQRWQDTEEFWQDLNKFAVNLKRIELAGGEPFMIKKQKILIDFLVNNNLSQDIEITWFTNCTIWPKELVSQFNKFKLVRIMLSIDNTDKKFEFQRWPAVWNDTYQIFLKFLELRNHGICQVEISHSVSALNILDLPDFHEWCSDHNIKVYNNLVVHPFNASDLPDHFKQLVRDKFKNHNLSNIQINPVTGVNNWLINLMNNPGNHYNIKYNLEYIKKTRPGLFEQAFPELAKFLNE